jgi:hypothetical protein
MVPIRAHNIFDEYFGDRWIGLQEDEEFRPIFLSRWRKDLDNLMID